MFDRGYLKLFRIKGIPVRAHWTVPLGMLMFSGGRMEPGMWVGVLLVIVLHELGHAFVVNRVGLVNAGIDLTGFGGLCRWVGRPTKKQRATVAWGGVLAQVVLLAVAAPIFFLVTIPWDFVNELLYALTYSNLVIAAFNLIPFGGLDGKEAWPLLQIWWDERKRRREWKRKVGKPPKEPSQPQTLKEALREADERNRSGR